MGWKSTISITREEAMELLLSRIINCSDKELENALESLGFGDNVDLPYYGHNFMIEEEECIEP